MKTAKKTTSGKAPVAHGVGRRKSSVARIWLRPGKGNIVVNGEEAKTYFDTDHNRAIVATPLRVCPAAAYDVVVNVSGGGMSSQAGAISLGIARAIVSREETQRSVLRQHGLLTVDSRLKERKKYGQRGARRKFQFVKR